MSNQQLYFAIGLPCLTVISSLIISLFQMSGVREDIRQLRNEFSGLRNEFGGLRNEFGGLRGEFNTKLDLVVGKLYEHDTDIARLKDKTGL